MMQDTIKLFRMGVDVGKRVDPTAMVIALETPQRNPAIRRTETHYLVRHIEPIPLGTDYPTQVERILDVIIKGLQHFEHEPLASYDGLAEINVDVTGVGDGIVDLLRQRAVARRIPTGHGIYIRSCRFVHGEKITRAGREYQIGKAWFANRLQILAQNGQIHLPNTPIAKALAEELLDFDVNIDENGGEKYGAMRPGTHDDLVCALGLCTVQREQNWRY